MADTEFRIKLKIDNEAQFKQDIQKMMDDNGFVGSSMKKAAESGGGGAAAGAMGGGKGLAALIGPVTKIAAIAGAMFAVLQPAFNILKAIGKMIAEFLRPISDVIIILLMPLLLMLRPMVIIFRQLSAPFRKLAFQLVAQGTQIFQSGDRATGMQFFMKAAMTAFTPFLQLIIVILGEITKVIVSVGMQIFKWIVRIGFGLVSIITLGIDKLLGFFGIDSGLTEKLGMQLQEMEANAERNLEGFKAFIDQVVADTNTQIGEKAIESAQEMIAKGDVIVQEIRDAADMIAGKLVGTTAGEIFPQLQDEEKFPTAKSARDALLQNIATNQPELFQQIAAREGLDTSQYEVGQSPDLNTLAKDQETVGNFFTNLNQLTTQAYGPDGNLEQAYKGSYDRTIEQTTSWGNAFESNVANVMGPSGTVPTTVNEGLESVGSSTDRFAAAMQTAGDAAENAVNTALGAASRAIAAQQRFERALRALRRSRG